MRLFLYTRVYIERSEIMKERVFNLILCGVTLIYFVLAIMLYILFPKYNIFFDGWWVLIILIPSLSNLIFAHHKLHSLYFLLVSIFIYLSIYNVIDNKLFLLLTVSMAVILLIIGFIIDIVRGPNKKDTSKSVPIYTTIIGVGEEIIKTDFDGGFISTIFASNIIDLRNAKISNKSTIVTKTIFGSTEILLPDNFDVEMDNVNILGETENIKNSSKKNKNKIYIESTSILGSTKIKQGE